MKSYLHSIIRGILTEALLSKSETPWKTKSGAEFVIGRFGGKIAYVADVGLSVDSEDIHFIQNLQKFDPRVRMVIRDINTGSKIFWFRFKDKKVQVLRSKNTNLPLVLAIDNQRVTNNRKRTGEFNNYAEIVSFLGKNV